MPCETERVNVSAVPLGSVTLIKSAPVKAKVEFWLTLTDVGAVIVGLSGLTVIATLAAAGQVVAGVLVRQAQDVGAVVAGSGRVSQRGQVGVEVEREPVERNRAGPVAIDRQPVVLVPSLRVPCETERVKFSAVPLGSATLIASAPVKARVAFWLTLTDAER